MNSSYEFQMVGKENILTKSIQTQKKIHGEHLQWEYQNNFHLALLGEDRISKLKIRNNICQFGGRALKKTTEIVFNDQIFTIEDTYSISNAEIQMLTSANNAQQLQRQSKDEGNPTNDSDKNDVKDKDNPKKVYIFKKMRRRRLVNEGQDQQLRNTKNISKNFCKAFIAFLKSEKSKNFARKNIRESIRIYNSLLQHKKYNNKIIKQIISNKTLRSIFQYFLEHFARDWINGSRVNDKLLHLDAIDTYLGLFNIVQVQSPSSSQSSSSSSSSSSPSEELFQQSKQEEEE